jgi:hypothetical protein
MVVVLAKAGDDRRKVDRAVSMVVMAGEEPVGSARILGSNMVELCVCGCAGPLLSSIRPLCFNVRLSTFCRLRNYVGNIHLCWQRHIFNLTIHSRFCICKHSSVDFYQETILIAI